MGTGWLSTSSSLQGTVLLGTAVFHCWPLHGCNIVQMSCAVQVEPFAGRGVRSHGKRGALRTGPSGEPSSPLAQHSPFVCSACSMLGRSKILLVLARLCDPLLRLAHTHYCLNGLSMQRAELLTDPVDVHRASVTNCCIPCRTAWWSSGVEATMYPPAPESFLRLTT